MMTDKIKCMYSAKKYLKESVFKGKAEIKKSLNHGKHFILVSQGVRYYCAYKRERYKTFAKEYKYSEDVEGESLNQEWVREALRQSCRYLIFIYPDRAKKIRTDDFLYESMSNFWFRTVDKKREVPGYNGETVTLREVTYSVPITYLEDL